MQSDKRFVVMVKKFNGALGKFIDVGKAFSSSNDRLVTIHIIFFFQKYIS